MTLTYIFHSGYLIETEQCAVIFDYFQDTKGDHEGAIHDFLSVYRKPVYVFATHFHPDHYNPVVLTWKDVYKEVTFHYIFSNDIRRRRSLAHDAALFLRRGEKYEDASLYAKAYGSTDAGISFFVELNGKRFFHAGDLNNWHWRDESTPDEVRQSEQAYARELDFIAQDHAQFDVAMFPVDPRLGSEYAKGAVQFVERFHPKIFCPMHFGEAYYVCDALAGQLSEDCDVIRWREKGQKIHL